MPPIDPTATLDLADSEVAEVRATAGDAPGLLVRFAAARVAGGWLGGATLALADARWQGDPAGCFGRLAAGRLDAGGARRALPLPGRLDGPLRLFLEFANGARLAVAAASLEAAAAPGAAFREDHSC